MVALMLLVQFKSKIGRGVGGGVTASLCVLCCVLCCVVLCCGAMMYNQSSVSYPNNYLEHFRMTISCLGLPVGTIKTQPVHLSGPS